MPSPLRVKPLRQIYQQVILPPWADGSVASVTVHNLAEERRILWHEIERQAIIRSHGQRLWASKRDFNRYWPEFRAFIKQARVYDDAAQAAQGASSALLAYYSALNLAKAELLIKRPETIFHQTIGHGLRYSPSTRGIRSDYITTADGVFPLLYESRVGSSLARRQQLRIIDLLNNTSDVGAELASAALGKRAMSRIGHLHAIDYENNRWTVVLFFEPDPEILRSPATRRFLGDEFEQVRAEEVPVVASLFGSPIPAPTHCLQGKRLYKLEADDHDGRRSEMLRDTGEFLRPVQNHSPYSHDEWAPSLRRTSWLPMPSDMARYAAMFYCSSVARYRPAMLHEDREGEASWILTSFVAEAQIMLLRSALQGITGAYFDLRS
jgi:hypothetical protein